MLRNNGLRAAGVGKWSGRSVLQCVAVCRGVLQCVCSVLQCGAGCSVSRSTCVAGCCSLLKCVAMCWM